MVRAAVVSAFLLALAIHGVSAKRYASGGRGGSGFRRQVVNGQVVWLMEQKIQHGPNLATYMADSYAQCSSAGNSANLPWECATGWKCACQSSGSSRCLPSGVATNAGCSQYNGASVATADYTWSLSGNQRLNYMQTEGGQCGGYSDSDTSGPWTTTTVCPIGNACECSNTYYSSCAPSTALTAGGVCSGFPLTSLYDCEMSNDGQAPTATAESWEQCGGWCYNGATRCPGNQQCYFMTKSNPWGYYAACDSTRRNTNYQSVASPLPTPTRGDFPLSNAATTTTPFPVTTSSSVTTPSPVGSGGLVQTSWGQCGGSTYTGPTSCPLPQGCWMKTSPMGYYAMCAATRPGKAYATATGLYMKKRDESGDMYMPNFMELAGPQITEAPIVHAHHQHYRPGM